jgi:3-isopropylmalate dehydrogenase
MTQKKMLRWQSKCIGNLRLWKKQYKPWKKTIQSHCSYEFVDAVAMRLVQWPNSYDVLITENLFGDILTDEASVISDLWD